MFGSGVKISMGNILLGWRQIQQDQVLAKIAYYVGVRLVMWAWMRDRPVAFILIQHYVTVVLASV